jgi:hypothetical protein
MWLLKVSVGLVVLDQSKGLELPRFSRLRDLH